MTSLPNSITEFLTQPYELTQEQIHFYQKFRYIKLKEVPLKLGFKIITNKSVKFLNWPETQVVQGRRTDLEIINNK
jgi:hypothetical protein